MKLSFIIPAYNEESCIHKCLSSILEGTKNHPENFEIIVVNNASTDNTKKIALSFEGVKVIDEPQKGLAKARQTGYLVATGDLIANVDSDNILPPKWINKTLSEFEKNKNLIGLSGPLQYYDLPQWTNLLINFFYAIGFISYVISHFILRRSGMLQGGNFIIKKTALDEIGGFDTSIQFYGEDTDVARRLQKLGLIKFTFFLPMYSSGRRLKNEGIFATGYKYIVNYLWIIFFKKPLNNETVIAHRVKQNKTL